MGMAILMNDKFEGIILKQLDYKDNSVILKVILKQIGKVSLIANGARKVTSKNAMNILPFTKAEFLFDYSEFKTMFRLKSATSKNLFPKLHQDLFISTCASMMCELVDAISIEEDELSEIYTLLEQGLELLGKNSRYDIVTCIFFARCFDVLGMAINVDACAVCGKKTVTQIDMKEGGFLCEDCMHKAGLKPLSLQSLRQFRMLNKAGYEHYDILAQQLTDCHQDLEKMIQFLYIHTGIQIQSFKFYKQLFLIEEKH